MIFDMDGTLTEELLDFDAIRTDIGIPERMPILEAIAQMSEHERMRAHAILDRHELSAAESALLHEGAVELLTELGNRGILAALLTRNSARCARTILQRHGLRFAHVATRENPPYKPHPDSILNVTRALRTAAKQTLMVGDYLYDLQAAAAAGVDSALLCQKSGGTPPAFAAQATYCVAHLRDILPLVEGQAASL